MSAPSRARLATAFFAVYVLWGSTYLFIKLAVAAIPPLGMAGARYLLAGGLLYGWARWRGAAPGTGAQWRGATVVGVALMASNAGVAWSEQFVPSGVASLLVAITPCWMLLFEWRGRRDRLPHPGVLAGLALGTTGVVLLIGPDTLLGGGRIHLGGAAAVLGGTALWAMGSLYVRHAPRPASPTLLSGMQMLAGGAVLSVLALATGQWRGFSPAATPWSAWIAFGYLVTGGSLLGYSAYIYLLTVTSSARASTYAYVNPVVAVLLGWAVAGEAFTARVAAATAIIVSAVALIVTFGAAAPAARR